MKEKRCGKCKTAKSIEQFGVNKATKDGLNYACRECHNRVRRDWSKANRKASNAALRRYIVNNPQYRLWVGAKQRANKNGKPFSITREDINIPKICPILGIELYFGENHCCDNSPSLDCIIPELGYVIGNIAVISHRANSIKSNATAEELVKVASWLKEQMNTQGFNSTRPTNPPA